MKLKAYLQNRSKSDYLALTAILLLIVYFYYQFFNFSSNIPVNDDYKAVLQFINAFKEAGTFGERMALMFAQSNEHRIFYDRIWTLISYKIYGRVDFNFLSFIGNLSYFVIFLVMAIPFRKMPYVYLIPVAVLVFNFAFHENMTFAMATLSNNTGFLFCLLSIYFATDRNSKAQYLSFLFYILAILSVGSGLFLTVILPLIFIYRRQWKMLAIFCAVAIITIGLYFIDYHKPPQTPDIFETLQFFKFRVVLFFVSFIGSAFTFYLIFTNDLNDAVIFSAIMGTLMLSGYFYLLRKQYYKDNLFMFSVITFVFISAALTSISRAQFGIETAIASRYRLYSAVAVIGYVYFFVRYVQLSEKVKVALVLTGSLLYFVGVSHKQIEYLAYREQLNYIGAINYLSGNHKLLNGFEQDVYKEILEDSKNNQTYDLPVADINNYFPYSIKIPNSTLSTNTDFWFTQSVEYIYELDDSFLIIGKAFLDKQSSYTQEIVLELEDTVSKETITFAAAKVKRYDMNPYFKKNNLDYGGFVCRIKKSDIGNNEYIIKLAITNGNLYKKETTDKKIKKSI